jgi:hypothetical protein
MNYNARPQNHLSHLEMVLLEQVFLPVRGWENLSPLLATANDDVSDTEPESDSV